MRLSFVAQLPELPGFEQARNSLKKGKRKATVVPSCFCPGVEWKEPEGSVQ